MGEARDNAAAVPIYSFVYRNGVITQIPSYPGAFRTRPFSINNRGEIVGRIEMPGVDADQFGFILRNGKFETFHILAGTSITPFGINDRGDVTGTYLTPERVGPNQFSSIGTTFIRRAK